MKKTLAIVTVLALACTTGFTCSKQTPDNAPTTPPPAELPAPTQEQMAAPPAGTNQTEVPTEGAPPAAPTTAPAAVPAPGAGH